MALAAGVIGFGLHAARPERRLAGLVAAGELLILIWLQLGQAGVSTVEAYSLPLALLLLAVGVVADRLNPGGEPAPSWVTFGPALVVGAPPTVWLSFSEPGSVRPLDRSRLRGRSCWSAGSPGASGPSSMSAPPRWSSSGSVSSLRWWGRSPTGP